MAIVDKFLYCFELKFGVLIIGFVDIILSILCGCYLPCKPCVIPALRITTFVFSHRDKTESGCRYFDPYTGADYCTWAIPCQKFGFVQVLRRWRFLLQQVWLLDVYIWPDCPHSSHWRLYTDHNLRSFGTCSMLRPVHVTYPNIPVYSSRRRKSWLPPMWPLHRCASLCCFSSWFG